MAHVTVVREIVSPFENILRVCWQRISRAFVSDEEEMLRRGDRKNFQLACGFRSGAACEEKQACRQRQQHGAGTHCENRLVHVDPSAKVTRSLRPERSS